MGEKQLLKSEFLFYNANILKIMMTWKIVEGSKSSVLYIYIYIYIQTSTTKKKQVKELETDPLFNSGRGSAPTANGTVEMEASIMDGNGRQCGAVSGLTTVKNLVSLAQLKRFDF